MTLDDLFNRSSVDQSTGCIRWNGHVSAKEYGKVWHEDRMYYAHHLAFKLARGEIPTGLVLDHLCRVPSCINPDHLEAVSQRENTMRGVGPSKENALKTHCIHGHPLSGPNLYIHAKTGYRYCKACGMKRCRARRLALRVAS